MLVSFLQCGKTVKQEWDESNGKLGVHNVHISVWICSSLYFQNMYMLFPAWAKATILTDTSAHVNN